MFCLLRLNFYSLKPMFLLTTKVQTSPNPWLRLSSQTSWERLPIYKIERVENGCQMDARWRAWVDLSVCGVGCRETACSKDWTNNKKRLKQQTRNIFYQKFIKIIILHCQDRLRVPMCWAELSGFYGMEDASEVGFTKVGMGQNRHTIGGIHESIKHWLVVWNIFYVPQ